MHAFGHHHFVAPGDAQSHKDSVHGRAAAVVDGGVTHVHGRQAAHHRLELKDALQSALADLRLVGRVGGHEFGALEDGVHHGRHEVTVSPGAQEGEAAGRHVLGGQFFQV